MKSIAKKIRWSFIFPLICVLVPLCAFNLALILGLILLWQGEAEGYAILAGHGSAYSAWSKGNVFFYAIDGVPLGVSEELRNDIEIKAWATGVGSGLLDWPSRIAAEAFVRSFNGRMLSEMHRVSLPEEESSTPLLEKPENRRKRSR